MASEHYLRVTDHDFAKASAVGGEGTASGTARKVKMGQRQSHIDAAAQSSTVKEFIEKALEKLGLSNFVQLYAKPQSDSVAGAGLEPARPFTGHRILSQTECAR